MFVIRYDVTISPELIEMTRTYPPISVIAAWLYEHHSDYVLSEMLRLNGVTSIMYADHVKAGTRRGKTANHDQQHEEETHARM